MWMFAFGGSAFTAGALNLLQVIMGDERFSQEQVSQSKGLFKVLNQEFSEDTYSP